MKEKYYYCYSTNNKLLGEKSRKLLKKIKHSENHHDFTSLIAHILSLSSLLIDGASKSINIDIDEPHYKNEKLAEKLHFNIALRPVAETEESLLDEEHLFKKITQKMEHDNFNLFTDEDYGDVLKYTNFLHLDSLNIDKKADFNKYTTEFAVAIFYYIKKGYITREDKLQLPIGKELFNIKLNCNAKY
jgi:hypothetical protein